MTPELLAPPTLLESSVGYTRAPSSKSSESREWGILHTKIAKPPKAIAPAIQKIKLEALRQNSARRHNTRGPTTAPIESSVRSESPSIVGPGSAGTNSSAGSSSASSEKPRWSSLNRSAKDRSELVPARQELAARGSTSAVESSVSGEVSVEFDSAGGTVKGPSPSMMACQAASSVSSSSGEEPVMLNTLDCPPGVCVSTRRGGQ